MRTRLLVLGSGELGTACALSLLANGAAASCEVTMVGRDRDYLHDVQYGSRTFRLADRRIRAPSGLTVRAVDAEPIKDDVGVDAVLSCVPATCLENDGAHTPPMVRCAQNHADAPMLLFTRGFTREGLTPLEQLGRVSQDLPSKLVVVSGPLFAREWAVTSAAACDGGDANRNSGVTLSFALGGKADVELSRSLQSLTERLWRRESVTWLDGPLAAEILSLVNGCVPLCSMGAGLVSSEYPGSVSATMSYLQHATSATEQLVNGVLGLPLGSPLPSCAVATIAMACTNHAAREFVFGRRLDYHFRHRDAIRAVFPAGSHEALDSTVSGLHMLLRRHAMSSPFYEVLMDTFLTLMRASVAGRELVRLGHYEYRHKLRDEDTVLLRHTEVVDEAMLSGDHQRFDDARRALQMAFGDSSCGAPTMPPL
ncbi:NAD-dependent glycerol-3-phosphate dehydrogenase N-terminus, putative [Trypanosoma equiperdum]|uniref:Glycerol-3-phosphate dehydrogenase NAD-dependent N-terminal domain-containing protein n=2 Tax=Trypanozoon TaxID=39700 RepID=Q582Q7_TRYB2|nr:hypothetical protein, conserved [Trypanosoma brucei brucei TREU927]XP_844070.1 hypothetical protein, conserved [Trypanosoma brucei brucei TREU927]AAX80643.1 hypothetical protein, conserved [Trypanosoma brucei]SCU68719.1 NAD-dependent glycerol-3-phosphate dehydrogenase N-terminus, putative [Trypanosoma equiperdum]AAX80647.1 hypothetical protein, conserved [Trypanosoma brucei]AAZ10507.1 hypothetical protein, conserved [Trypanosoma brucei brucei TREU927]AAZ10511.1 hypothetical protein, conser